MTQVSVFHGEDGVIEMGIKSTQCQDVLVECVRPDGSVCMHAGRIVRRDEQAIVLADACWIAMTGRRHLFMQGKPDASAEWEPLDSRSTVELPAAGSVITTWPHGLEMFRQAK